FIVIFFLALASGTLGGIFVGVSNIVCRLVSRFIGRVEVFENLLMVLVRFVESLLFNLCFCLFLLYSFG
ncbi:hypothetical protein QLF84_23350, partial [Salmonella enterica subsp. enterica serovar Oslo]|nr:hypothetical protein [Salmonella enterica subsp. enterica serovar Oslo]